MKTILKRITIVLIVLTLCLPTLFCADTYAAAKWPSLSSSSYCEFTAAKQINVYKDTSCKTRGTSSPAKAYKACISKNDVCKIYKITSSYVQVNYPTSSGMRTGYVKRSDLFSKSAPVEQITSKGKATTYITPKGRSYGNVAKNDRVYACGTSNGYTAVIYTAKSGKRAYKFGWVTTNNYNSIIKKGAQGSNTASSSTLLFPLKGSITKSSNSAKTNGYYCDYKTGGAKAIYAPANGTVVYKQAYRNQKGGKKLSSYGNYIEFKSSDGKYTVKCCHLSSFNGVNTKIKNSLPYKCSGSDGTLTLKTKSVKQGELLGYSGKTGNASGHHLHLEVRKNGKPVNPISVFKTWK